jgi:hypothetical protein
MQMKGFRLLFPLLFGGLLVVGLLFMVEIGAEAGPALQAPDVWAEAAPAPRDIGFYGST